MVLFMPWCRIDKAYKIDEIDIYPFERHKLIEGLDDDEQRSVNTIMATYKTIEGKPVDRAALVRYADKSLIDNLTEDEREIVQELVVMACFCGLAKRDYFNPGGRYSNSDCFTLYIQKFKGTNTDFTAITTRRREGFNQDVWPIEGISITIPVHCHMVNEVSLDGALLNALVKYRIQAEKKEWARWQNAISCFTHANTDSENIPYQVEWVLLCSALEHLLNAKSNQYDVARKFSDVMIPSEPLLVSKARRRLVEWKDGAKSLRYEWMREFYRIRGDFAHGKLYTDKQYVWNPREHLVLATIAFPLVLKCLLEKTGEYKLTIEDLSQIDSFEALADTKDFLKPPPEQKSSIDTHWVRLCRDRKSKIAFEKTFKKAFKELNLD